MKRLTILFPVFLVFLVGFGCTPDDASRDIRNDNGNPKTDDDNNNNNQTTGDPSITFRNTPAGIAKAGDSVGFRLTLQSSSSEFNLSDLRMEVLRKPVGGAYTALPNYTKEATFSNVPATGTQMGFRLKNEDFNNKDSVKVKFTLNDEADNSKTKEWALALGKLIEDMYKKAGGDTVIPIHHKETTKQPPDNKYDLHHEDNTTGYVNPGGSAGNEATIADDSQTDSTFERRWTTETSADFVKANGSGINFNEIYDIQLAKAYQNGSPTQTLINLSEGDLIIVNLRDNGGLALLKIVNVAKDQNNTASSFISFKGKAKDIR